MKTVINVPDLYTLHYDTYPQNFRFGSETVNFWLLTYVDNGNIEYNVDGTVHHLQKSDILLIPPNIPHSMKTENNFTTAFVISFDCESDEINHIANKTIETGNSEQNILSVMLDEAEQTFDLPMFNNLFFRDTPRYGGSQIIKNLLEQLLIINIRKYFNEKEDTANYNFRDYLENELCNSIIKILQENILGKINLDDIAKQVNFSKSYICKIFKKNLGTSIINYFINKKIEKAKGLIKQNKHNFTYISEILGFENPHYFSRCFKNITHLSPIQYKNSIKRSLNQNIEN